jgi:UrcA family protein
MVGKWSANGQGGVVSPSGLCRPHEDVAKRAIPTPQTDPTMTRTVSTLALAAVTVGLLTAALPAAAQNPHVYDGYSHDPTRVVSYTRIDLTRADTQTPAGARAMLQRIETAADAVCGGPAHLKALPQDYAACRDEAVESAVRTLGAPAVRAALAEAHQRTLLAGK